MSKLLLVVLVALGAAAFYLGPSFFLGGPSKQVIVETARSVMLRSSDNDVPKALVIDTKLSPKGLCSSQGDGLFACIVETEIPGAEPKSFILEIKKENGAWVAVEG